MQHRSPAHPQKAAATVTRLLALDGDSEVLLKGLGPVWGTNLGEKTPHHPQHRVRGRHRAAV